MRSPRSLIPLVALSLLVACGDDAVEEPAASPIEAEGGVVAITGTDRLRWSAEQVTADTGELTVELTCEEAVNHNFVVDGELVAECAPGETATGAISLDAGEHEFVCTIPGHDRTMQGTLTVS